MIRRITRFIMVIAGILLIFMGSYSLSVKAAEGNYAYFTIEKFVLGQGYVLEPTKIEIGSNESVSTVLNRLAEREGISLMNRPTNYGLYLYGIKNADSGKYDIPSIILKYFYNDIKEYLKDGEPVKDDNGHNLEELSFSPFTGWLYFVNDEWQFTGMDSRYLSPNEVVRLKYTIAPGDSGWGMNGSEQISLPDESELIRILVEVKERKKQQPDNDLEEIYDDAISILSDLDASVLNVDRLTEYMRGVNQAILDNDKEKVIEIRTEINDLLTEVKAYDVIQKINIIPEILTYDTMFTVRNARAAYDALDNESLAYINGTIYDKLIRGEDRLSQLEEELRQQQLKADAKKVADMINAIEAVTLDKNEKISEIREAYNALEEDAKSMIDSSVLQKLIEAEAKIAELVKAKEEADKKAASYAISKINAIGSVTLAKKASITEARKAYDALSADAKKHISSSVLSKLTAAEKNLAFLENEQDLKKKYTPSKVTIKKAAPGKKKVKLTWMKRKGATGYQIFMSVKKGTGYKKIATIKKAKTVTFTKKKLQSKKTYYFRIRAYRKVGKKVYYGPYSAVKKAKIK